MKIAKNNSYRRFYKENMKHIKSHIYESDSLWSENILI